MIFHLLYHLPPIFRLSPPSTSPIMTRIFSSALRPIRLNAGRAFQGATEIASIPLGRRTYTPRSTTSSPPSSSTAPKPNTGYSQTTYKRSATTSSSSSSNNNNNNSSSPSAPRPATNSNSSPSSAPASRPATSAYAESQLNPVTQPPYVPPPGAGSIPETNPYAYQAFASSNNNNGIDWSSSFHGLSTTPFSPEVAAVLMKPIPFEDVEIKPDGIIYLPEIKYRRILNQAFGPGGWGMAPRGELMVGEKVVTREYALLVHGRYVFNLTLPLIPSFPHNTSLMLTFGPFFPPLAQIHRPSTRRMPILRQRRRRRHRRRGLQV